MELKKRTTLILTLLKKHYPHAHIALKYSNHFELLVAVILSAQCTDKMVNKVTEKLFPKYRQLKYTYTNELSYPINNYIQQIINFAMIPIEQFEQDIKSTGFYKNKAKNIQDTARMMLEKHNGQIPSTMKEMLTLKGVARKTASVVLGNAYRIVEGIAVDTHVKRLSYRLGLTKETDPVKIEADLMKLFPKQEWFDLTYKFIDHGRSICDAKKPRCDECFLNKLCPSAFLFPHFKK